MIADALDKNRSVHPHGCGERFRIIPAKLEWIGSSPRLWGTLEVGQVVVEFERFIPTAVGNAS